MTSSLYIILLCLIKGSYFVLGLHLYKCKWFMHDLCYYLSLCNSSLSFEIFLHFCCINNECSQHHNIIHVPWDTITSINIIQVHISLYQPQVIFVFFSWPKINFLRDISIFEHSTLSLARGREGSCRSRNTDSYGAFLNAGLVFIEVYWLLLYFCIASSQPLGSL